MPEFTIETTAFRQALATAIRFASTDDMLPMINVVHFEPAGDDTIEVVATDRFTLSVETLTVGGAPFGVSIPRDVAERLLTSRKHLLGSLATIAQEELEDGRRRITIRITNDACATGLAYDTALSFIAPGHNFVDYRDLIARVAAEAEAPAEVMGFDPKLLMRVCEAFAERRSEYDPMLMTFRGERNSVLLELGNLRVQAMPMRRESVARPATELVTA